LKRNRKVLCRGRNRQKTNSCVWGKARQRATQDPPRMAPGFGDFYTWRKRQIELPSAKSGRPIETPECGGGGNSAFFFLKFWNGIKKIKRNMF